ncbi:MAG: GxxExxY protein [Gammaproteobacteria bacterium]
MVLAESDLTYRIRGCVYEVYRQLGCGFLEAVYEKALIIEMRMQELQVESQVPVDVEYKGENIGHYYADLIVNGSVILELKAQSRLSPACEVQLLNYLRAANLHLGLLINFSYPKASIRRIIR